MEDGSLNEGKRRDIGVKGPLDEIDPRPNKMYQIFVISYFAGD
jgi:hypothetical protein